MGKLNYTNRKSEGLKLAHIVAKDLRKRAAASPTKADTSPLELDVPARGIPDEGALEISKALQELLAKGAERSNSRAEALDFSGNAFTAQALRHLAPAIQLSGPWLKDLDLSKNQISVTTDEEAEAWEEFLCSFDRCEGLRRIDLSGNNFSSTRAFEIFARVYCRQGVMVPTEALHDNADAGIAKITAAASDLTVSASSRCSPRTTLSLRRGGLWNIPYIVFSNVQMGDAGCLFLSYPLTQHPDPRQLLPPLKPGPVLAQLEEYDSATGCKGLIYSREGLSPFATKLLEAAETARSEINDFDAENAETHEDEASTPAAISSPTSRKENVHFSQYIYNAQLSGKEARKVHQNQRRSSIVSGDSGKVIGDRRKSSVFDLDSLRRKLQRETLEHHGANSVDLWRIAIKFMVFARRVLPPPKIQERASASTASSNEASKTLQRSVARGKGVKDLIPRDPEEVRMGALVRILRELVDPRRVLSEAQVTSVVTYARDKRTLATERDTTHKDESVQKWHVLEGLECLSYEMA